jgi:aryl-alcohol dehydrogenase-like predicted oxidoreductase
MKERELGHSGLQVTPLGLGLAALGRPGYINLGHAADLGGDYEVEAMAKHAMRVLDAAWDAGIRYYDAARSYGKAEAFLARWLAARDIPASEVTVGSKWGYTYTADWRVDADVHEVKEHSLPVLERQIGESRTLLGNHLDLYQIHSATLQSGVLDNAPVLAALAALKTSGLRIGLSLSGTGQAATLTRALAVSVDGVRLFDTVQATWNLLEPSTGPVLAEAAAAGMGVIVKEALANGRLTLRNEMPAFRQQMRLLQQVAAELETTVDALALGAAVAQPWASVVLSGAARVAHLVDNVEALKVRWDEGVARRLAGLVEAPEEYWQTRSALRWN